MTRSQRLVVALALNGVLVVGQLVAGLAARSTGLLADAAHNLTDVVAVLLSLAAVRWALRPRSAARSYGNHRGTILAALANAAVLGVITCAIVATGVYRLLHPVRVEGGAVVATAAAAVALNAAGAWLLREHRHDLNVRSVLVHLASDVMASFAVLVAGVAVVIGGVGWDRADPAASLVVAAFILIQALRIARESADVLLESTPRDLDVAALRGGITAVPGVGEVHDLHVWSLSSEYRVLSAHLVLTGHPTLEHAQEVARCVRAAVEGPFDIAHSTFELECERCDDVADDPHAGDERHAVPARATGR